MLKPRRNSKNFVSMQQREAVALSLVAEDIVDLPKPGTRGIRCANGKTGCPIVQFLITLPAGKSVLFKEEELPYEQFRGLLANARKHVKAQGKKLIQRMELGGFRIYSVSTSA